MPVCVFPGHVWREHAGDAGKHKQREEAPGPTCNAQVAALLGCVALGKSSPGRACTGGTRQHSDHKREWQFVRDSRLHLDHSEQVLGITREHVVQLDYHAICQRATGQNVGFHKRLHAVAAIGVTSDVTI